MRRDEQFLGGPIKAVEYWIMNPPHAPLPNFKLTFPQNLCQRARISTQLPEKMGFLKGEWYLISLSQASLSGPNITKILGGGNGMNGIKIAKPFYLCLSNLPYSEETTPSAVHFHVKNNKINVKFSDFFLAVFANMWRTLHRKYAWNTRENTREQHSTKNIHREYRKMSINTTFQLRGMHWMHEIMYVGNMKNYVWWINRLKFVELICRLKQNRKVTFKFENCYDPYQKS